MPVDIEQELVRWRTQIEQALGDALSFERPVPEYLQQGLRHAALTGGKRYRGLLVMAVGADLGVPAAHLLSSAVALELIHAASLVVDDLPSMDNASQRRTAPSTHAAFGEATALLCSISLLSRAHEIVARDASLTTAARVEVSGALAMAVGGVGLCAGQFDDLFPGLHVTETQLVERYRRKTGALFAAAMRCPGILSGAPSRTLARLEEAGFALGVAFQLHDDLIDLLSTAEAAGKDVGRDASKVTLATYLGADAAQHRAAAELSAARDEMASLCGEACATSLLHTMAGHAKSLLRAPATARADVPSRPCRTRE